MSYHGKQLDPAVKDQLKPLMAAVTKSIPATIDRVKQLDKNLKGYSDIGLIIYALERLEAEIMEGKKCGTERNR